MPSARFDKWSFVCSALSCFFGEQTVDLNEREPSACLDTTEGVFNSHPPSLQTQISRVSSVCVIEKHYYY